MATNQNTSVAVVEETGEIVTVNTGEFKELSTIQGSDWDTRVAVYEATQSAESLGEYLNKSIFLKNAIVQTVMMKNEDTGAMEAAPRVTLVDKDGKAYVATSKGVYNSVLALLDMLGHPSTWPVDSFEVHLVQQGKAPRAFYKLMPGAPKK